MARVWNKVNVSLKVVCWFQCYLLCDKNMFVCLFLKGQERSIFLKVISKKYISNKFSTKQFFKVKNGFKRNFIYKVYRPLFLICEIQYNIKLLTTPRCGRRCICAHGYFNFRIEIAIPNCLHAHLDRDTRSIVIHL